MKKFILIIMVLLVSASLWSQFFAKYTGMQIETILDYSDGVTPGTAQASKALILDASGNISLIGIINLPNNTFITATKYAGGENYDLIKLNIDDNIEYGRPQEIGNITVPLAAGVKTFINIDADGASAGAKHGITIMANDTDSLLSVITEDDGASGIQNTLIKSHYNFMIGSGAAGVDYTLIFNGETNDCILTYDEDNDRLNVGNTKITGEGGCLIIDNNTWLSILSGNGTLQGILLYIGDYNGEANETWFSLDDNTQKISFNNVLKFGIGGAKISNDGDDEGISVDTSGNTMVSNNFTIGLGTKHDGYVVHNVTEVQTTDATQTTIDSITLLDGNTYKVRLEVIGVKSTGVTNNGVYEKVVRVHRDGGGAVLGNITILYTDETSSDNGVLDATFTVNGNDIDVSVKGIDAEIWNFGCTMSYMNMSN